MAWVALSVDLHGILVTQITSELFYKSYVYKSGHWRYKVTYSVTNWIYHVTQKSTLKADLPVYRFLGTPMTTFFRAWKEHLPVYQMDFYSTCFYGNRKIIVGLDGLHIWASFGFNIGCQHQIELGSQVDILDAHGRTPLSWAAQYGHLEVVKLLVEKDAEIETKDSKYGQTPLSWAAENGHLEVVKLLVEKDAEIENTDTDGRTPLSWAAAKGHLEVVKLLEEKGAVIDRTPGQQKKVAKLLVETGDIEQSLR